MGLSPRKLEHIFWGEISRRNRPKGYHHEDNSYGDACLRKFSNINNSGRNVQVLPNGEEIYDGNVGNKRYTTPRLKLSTFFPYSWSRQKVVDCIAYSRPVCNINSVTLSSDPSINNRIITKTGNIMYDSYNRIVLEDYYNSAFPVLRL